MKKYLLVILCLSLILIPSVYNGCSKSVGSNGVVVEDVRSLFLPNQSGEVDETLSTGGGNPLTQNLKLSLAEYHPRAIHKLVFCISQLSFKHLKMPKGQPQDKDVNFKLGDIEILPSGTELIDLELLDGTYEKIELTLDAKRCASKKSVQLFKQVRSLSTDETIKLSFVGLFTAQNVQMELRLRLDDIIQNLNKVQEDSEIKPAIESVEGFY